MAAWDMGDSTYHIEQNTRKYRGRWIDSDNPLCPNCNKKLKCRDRNTRTDKTEYECEACGMTIITCLHTEGPGEFIDWHILPKGEEIT